MKLRNKENGKNINIANKSKAEAKYNNNDYNNNCIRAVFDLPILSV